ncbi:MAG: GTPase, partial [Eubacterium sp.]|nr:GTPase [Eubacterium sp.]
MNKEIPVYVFMGFLESGKTTFAKETLIERGFNEGKSALLLVAEEGEVEYDKEALEKNNIHLELIDDDTLNEEHLLDLSAKYKPELVLIEYNGMWELDKIFNIRVPKGWTVVQVLSFVNAQTFDVYVNNMKKIMMDQIRNADMIIFNRCDENTKKSEYRKSLRAVNRRAQVIFENADGSVDNGSDEELILPYDITKD